METAFTVDRQRALTPGLVIDRFAPSVNGDAALIDHLHALFPNGVTRHGERYLFGRGGAGSPLGVEPEAEMICELVRRLSFPDNPSRFESVFGCRSLEGAREFRAARGQSDDPIFEVQAASVFDGDMNCVGGELPPVVISYFAHRYWSGLQGPAGADPTGAMISPRWEVLLVPPVEVVRQVDP